MNHSSIIQELARSVSQIVGSPYSDFDKAQQVVSAVQGAASATSTAAGGRALDAQSLTLLTLVTNVTFVPPNVLAIARAAFGFSPASAPPPPPVALLQGPGNVFAQPAPFMPATAGIPAAGYPLFHPAAQLYAAPPPLFVHGAAAALPPPAGGFGAFGSTGQSYAMINGQLWVPGLQPSPPMLPSPFAVLPAAALPAAVEVPAPSRALPTTRPAPPARPVPPAPPAPRASSIARSDSLDDGSSQNEGGRDAGGSIAASRNSYRRSSNNEYSTFDLMVEYQHDEIGPCPSGGVLVRLGGGDNRSPYRIVKRYKCNGARCDYTCRAVKDDLPGESPSWHWEVLDSNANAHYQPPANPTIADIMAAVRAFRQRDTVALPRAVYQHLLSEFGGAESAPQLQSFVTFRNFLQSQEYNRRMSEDPTETGSPIMFGSGLVEYSQRHNIFNRMTSAGVTPDAQYASKEAIAAALECPTTYTELTIPVIPSDIEEIPLSERYAREAMTSVLVTCPAHLWSLLTFTRLFHPQWRVVHMDSTGCLVAGAAVLMSLAGIRIDADPSGRPEVHRTCCPFIHCFTKSEKLIAALVMLKGLTRVALEFFGFDLIIENVVTDYSKALRGTIQEQLPWTMMSLCMPHISRAIRGNSNWRSSIRSRDNITHIGFYIQYLMHSRMRLMFVRSFDITIRVFQAIGEPDFATLMTRYYGPLSASQGNWYYNCFELPFLIPDNQPMEAYYRGVKGSSRLGIPPRIRMNCNVENFLREEIPELLRNDSIYNCGVTYNASGQMLHMNPSYETLAMCALLDPERDIHVVRDSNGNATGEYLVNAHDFAGMAWTDDRVRLYSDITGDLLDSDDLPSAQYSQAIIDLFKRRNVNNGDTVQGICKGALHFVQGICHIKKLPPDAHATDHSQRYCVCEEHQSTKYGGDCPGRRLVNDMLGDHRSGMPLNDYFTQMYVRASARRDPPNAVPTRSRRPRTSVPEFRRRARMHVDNTMFHVSFGIDGMPVIPQFQYLQSLTNKQLLITLNKLRRSIPDEYRRSGRHCPREILIATIIAGTSLGCKMAEAISHRPGVAPTWLRKHQEMVAFHQSRSDSYRDCYRGTHAPIVVPSPPPVVAPFALPVDNGNFPIQGLVLTRTYVVGTHAAAFPHLAGCESVAANFLALHSILSQADAPYNMYNDQELCAAVNNGLRSIANAARAAAVARHQPLGARTPGMISRCDAMNHVIQELFRNDLGYGLHPDDREDLICDPELMNLLGEEDEALFVLQESISGNLEETGRPCAATFSTATLHVAVLCRGMHLPFEYHVVDLRPHSYQHTNAGRNDNVVKGGTRTVCADSNSLSEILYQLWKSEYPAGDIETNPDPLLQINERSEAELELDARVVTLQCFLGKFRTPPPTDGLAEVDTIDFGYPTSLLEEMTDENDEIITGQGGDAVRDHEGGGARNAAPIPYQGDGHAAAVSAAAAAQALAAAAVATAQAATAAVNAVAAERHVVAVDTDQDAQGTANGNAQGAANADQGAAFIDDTHDAAATAINEIAPVDANQDTQGVANGDAQAADATAANAAQGNGDAQAADAAAADAAQGAAIIDDTHDAVAASINEDTESVWTDPEDEDEGLLPGNLFHRPWNRLLEVTETGEWPPLVRAIDRWAELAEQEVTDWPAASSLPGNVWLLAEHVCNATEEFERVLPTTPALVIAASISLSTADVASVRKGRVMTGALMNSFCSILGRPSFTSPMLTCFTTANFATELLFSSDCEYLNLQFSDYDNVYWDTFISGYDFAELRSAFPILAASVYNYHRWFIPLKLPASARDGCV